MQREKNLKSRGWSRIFFEMHIRDCYVLRGQTLKPWGDPDVWKRSTAAVHGRPSATIDI